MFKLRSLKIQRQRNQKKTKTEEGAHSPTQIYLRMTLRLMRMWASVLGKVRVQSPSQVSYNSIASWLSGTWWPWHSIADPPPDALQVDKPKKASSPPVLQGQYPFANVGGLKTNSETTKDPSRLVESNPRGSDSTVLGHEDETQKDRNPVREAYSGKSRGWFVADVVWRQIGAIKAQKPKKANPISEPSEDKRPKGPLGKIAFPLDSPRFGLAHPVCGG